MIRIYVLNGALMPDRGAMHTHLKVQFALPDYYGDNLDALWDCLSVMQSGTIVFHNAELAAKSAALPLVGLLLDLCRENPAWQLELHSGFPDCHKACSGCEPQAEVRDAQDAPDTAPEDAAGDFAAGRKAPCPGTQDAWPSWQTRKNAEEGGETVACGAMEDVCPYEL